MHKLNFILPLDYFPIHTRRSKIYFPYFLAEYMNILLLCVCVCKLSVEFHTCNFSSMSFFDIEFCLV